MTASFDDGKLAWDSRELSRAVAERLPIVELSAHGEAAGSLRSSGRMATSTDDSDPGCECPRRCQY